jgi:hypothetical protein
MDDPEVTSLLDLPDPCLLAVLRCCCADPHTLFSAARANSRLRQAAAVALSSISSKVNDQQQLQSLLVYLNNHTSDVTSLTMQGPISGAPYMLELPAALELCSLDIANLPVRLTPGDSFAGVLHAWPGLKKLRLSDCLLVDEGDSLHAALLLLPTLHHLSLEGLHLHGDEWDMCAPFKLEVLDHLQRLTFLELKTLSFQHDGSNVTHPLEQLTDLQCLQLASNRLTVSASTTSGMQQLTHLELGFWTKVEAAALGHLLHLQHLDIWFDVDVAAALSHLQQMTQLTYLRWGAWDTDEDVPLPAAAYSALTASSHLQHLEVRSTAAIHAPLWQHLLPTARLMPHLQVLMTYELYHPDQPGWSCSDVPRFVTSCPGLRKLTVGADCSSQQLAQLSGLTGLRQLAVGVVDNAIQPLAQMEALAELTALQGLTLFTSCGLDCVLELMQLRHLTSLVVQHTGNASSRMKVSKTPCLDGNWKYSVGER